MPRGEIAPLARDAMQQHRDVLFYPASYSWQILLERLRFGGNRLRYLCIAKLLRDMSAN
jgi:hypothetical protein